MQGTWAARSLARMPSPMQARSTTQLGIYTHCVHSSHRTCVLNSGPAVKALLEASGAAV